MINSAKLNGTAGTWLVACLVLWIVLAMDVVDGKCTAVAWETPIDDCAMILLVANWVFMAVSFVFWMTLLALKSAALGSNISCINNYN